MTRTANRPDEMLLWAAQKYAQMSRYRLLLKIAAGEIRTRTVGGRLFLNTADLDRLLAERAAA